LFTVNFLWLIGQHVETKLRKELGRHADNRHVAKGLSDGPAAMAVAPGNQNPARLIQPSI